MYLNDKQQERFFHWIIWHWFNPLNLINHTKMSY